MNVSQQGKNVRNGAAVVLTVVLLVVILGMVAFAVDVGMMMRTDTSHQLALDAAALAGANELFIQQEKKNFHPRRHVAEKILAAASANDPRLSLDALDFELFDSDPTDSKHQVDAVRVTLVDPPEEATFFARILGRKTYTVGGSAAAKTKFGSRDIVFVLDLTGSMASQGRIEALQSAFPSIISYMEAERPNDRLAVIGFATDDGKGVLEVPLGSRNHAQCKAVPLEHSQYEIIRGTPHTATGNAILEALAHLESEGNRNASRHIIVMTDGEHNRGIDPRIASDRARRKNIIVHGIALGKDASMKSANQMAGKGYKNKDLVGFAAKTKGDSKQLFRAFRDAVLTGLQADPVLIE